jgi:hypothetical protein
MKYMMSKRALGKAAVIQGAVEGNYMVKQAAAKLRISEREQLRQENERLRQGNEQLMQENEQLRLGA